jgi:hypothetical protein
MNELTNLNGYVQYTKNIFDFVSHPGKVLLLNQANELLHINKFPNNKLIFVYSGPKVGSTSIVSSLRIFGTDKFSVIHIHDEEMLYVLRKIRGITINEIILYYSHIGREDQVRLAPTHPLAQATGPSEQQYHRLRIVCVLFLIL